MQSWSGHYSIDTKNIEDFYSQEDGVAFMDSIFADAGEDELGQIDRVRQVIEQLPPREADFVDLYYFKRLKQTDIASLFGVSQPTVCYRLSRAADRIRFLLNLPPVEERVLTGDMNGFLSDPIDAQIMILMWKTTCQSEVAKRLGFSQGLIRHRFLRSLARMRSNIQLVRYVALFDYIAANLNILREASRVNMGDDGLVRCLH